MGLTLSEQNSGPFTTKIPPGLHDALCIGVYDLGTQFNSYFKEYRNEVLIAWELFNTRDEEGKPFVVTERYTASLDTKSNLRKLLRSWRTRDFTPEELAGFQLTKILGVPCQLNMVHQFKSQSGSTYANVENVLPYRGPQPPAPVNPVCWFDIDADAAVPEGAPKRVADLVAKSTQRGGQGRAAEPQRNGHGHPQNGYAPPQQNGHPQGGYPQNGHDYAPPAGPGPQHGQGPAPAQQGGYPQNGYGQTQAVYNQPPAARTNGPAAPAQGGSPQGHPQGPGQAVHQPRPPAQQGTPRAQPQGAAPQAYHGGYPPAPAGAPAGPDRGDAYEEDIPF